MANLTETSQWEAGVTRIETTDRVLGGESGPLNAGAKKLANRTRFLKDAIDALIAKLGLDSNGRFNIQPTVGNALTVQPTSGDGYAILGIGIGAGIGIGGTCGLSGIAGVHGVGAGGSAAGVLGWGGSANGVGVEGVGGGNGAGVVGGGGAGNGPGVVGNGGFGGGKGVVGNGGVDAVGGEFTGGGDFGFGVIAKGAVNSPGLEVTGGANSIYAARVKSTFASGSALYAETTEPGTILAAAAAVHGYARGLSTGVLASSDNGYSLHIRPDTTSPVRAAVRWEPQNAVPTGAHQVGDMYVDSNGRLRTCIVAGTPGTFATVKGTTTNDNAVAGEVGEYIEAVVLRSAPVGSWSNDVVQNVASISLTPGDWDVSLMMGFGGALTGTKLVGGISTTSASLPSTDAIGRNRDNTPTMPTATCDVTLKIPRWRVSLSTPQTVYAVGLITFSAGTPIVYGTISARRRR